MTIAVATTKTGFDATTDAVSSANMMTYANSVDNLLNNILNGAQAFDKQLYTAAATMQIDANGAIGVPTQALIHVSAYSGVVGSLRTIGVSNNRYVILKATSGHTIGLLPTFGNLTSIDDGTFFLTGDRMALLYCHNGQYALIGSTAGSNGLGINANLTATSDPGSGEDSADGYSVGSLWANVSADKAFVNVDASSGLAIWKPITPPKNSWNVRASNATATGTGITSPTTANAPANANDNNNTFMTLPTTAAAGNLAGWITTTFNLIRASYDPTIEIIVKTGAAADLANQRIWIGLVDAEISNVDTLAAGREFIGFRYSSAAADPGWMPVLHDGTTQNVGTVLGGVIAASTVYKLKIRIVSGGTPTAYFSVNDGAEQAMQTNFPAIATDLGAICRNIPVTAVIRTMSFSSFDVRWG